MMNKIKIVLLACAVPALVISCSNEIETHELTPVDKPYVLYADHTLDSLLFYSFDSWTATPQVDWLSIYGDSHTEIKNDNTKYFWTIHVSVKPNATGQTRKGSVLVQSYDYSYSSPVIQLGLLNLSHPDYIVDSWLDEKARIPEVAHYELIDSAHWTSDSICFTVENSWELAFEGEAPNWLSYDRMFGSSDEHYRVNLTLERNTDRENERRATLRLTSGEVSNIITVRQLPAGKRKSNN